MADPVMSDLSLRRVLECVGEQYQTAKEIEKEYTKRFPRELEAFIKVSDTLRRFVFKEKKGPTVEELLSVLADRGYVETCTTSFFRVELDTEMTFYCLNNKGRSALWSVARSRRS